MFVLCCVLFFIALYVCFELYCVNIESGKEKDDKSNQITGKKHQRDENEHVETKQQPTAATNSDSASNQKEDSQNKQNDNTSKSKADPELQPSPAKKLKTTKEDEISNTPQ